MVILSLGHVARGELKLNVSVATVRFVRSLIGCLFLRLHCKALLQRWPLLPYVKMRCVLPMLPKTKPIPPQTEPELKDRELSLDMGLKRIKRPREARPRPAELKHEGPVDLYDV